MATALVQIESPIEQSGLTLVRFSDRAREYVREAKAPNTRKAYRSDWRDFEAWCSTHQLASMPASAGTVAMYLTALADRGSKASTIQRLVSAISQAHQAAGFESPTQTIAIRTLLAGIRRTIGTAQTGKASAVTADICDMVGGLPEGLLGVRDRATPSRVRRRLPEVRTRRARCRRS